MCPANCQSRDPALAPLILPKPFVAVLFHVVPGPFIVVLFQTLMQSASNTKVPKSFGNGKLRWSAASRSCVPGFLRFRGCVRGAFPMSQTPFLISGFLNFVWSTYRIGWQPETSPRLQVLVPFGPVP